MNLKLFVSFPVTHCPFVPDPDEESLLIPLEDESDIIPYESIKSKISAILCCS